jgi:hypothetical protein
MQKPVFLESHQVIQPSALFSEIEAG